MDAPEKFDLDLGDGHWLRWVRWEPDRKLNPKYADFPDVEKYGAIVTHTTDKTETGLCEGYIEFVSPAQQFAVDPNQPAWTVIDWEPLTITPSLLCGCGDHGFISGGKWVRA